jgi:hypothetical protein
MTSAAIEQLRAKSRPGGCGTGLWIKEHTTGKMRSTIDEALADPLIRSGVLWRWMQEMGYPLSQDSLEKHRGGRCSCGQ